MQKTAKTPQSNVQPETNPAHLRNESDVEQKLIYPLFANPAFLDYKHEWIHTKQFIPTANIGKGAKRRTGYTPDYVININGFPIAVCEAKSTDIAITLTIQVE
jgi:type I site-specific restriction endonuclease